MRERVFFLDDTGGSERVVFELLRTLKRTKSNAAKICSNHWLISIDSVGREPSNLDNAHQYDALTFDGLCMGGADLDVTDENVHWLILFKLHRRFFRGPGGIFGAGQTGGGTAEI